MDQLLSQIDSSLKGIKDIMCISCNSEPNQYLKINLGHCKQLIQMFIVDILIIANKRHIF